MGSGRRSRTLGRKPITHSVRCDFLTSVAFRHRLDFLCGAQYDLQIIPDRKIGGMSEDHLMRAIAKNKIKGPFKVRKDPPTLEEAVFAAQGFIDDIDQQAEFAAMLMDMPFDEARALAVKVLASAKRVQAQEVAYATDRSGGQRAVVVERKADRRPAVTVERKKMFAPPTGVERSGGVTVERRPFLGLPGGAPRTLIKLGARR